MSEMLKEVGDSLKESVSVAKDNLHFAAGFALLDLMGAYLQDMMPIGETPAQSRFYISLTQGVVDLFKFGFWDGPPAPSGGSSGSSARLY